MEWCNSCENSRPVAGVWAVCFIWTLARIEAFAFSWRSSASFNLYWLTVLYRDFFADIFALWEQLFTDFTDIFPEIDKPREECGKCHLCTSKCTMGMDLTKKDRIAGGECISCQKCVSWCPKGNAHFRSRYGVLIGVGVTCATIMVSQLLIAGNLAKEKTADSVKKTAENDAGGNFQNGIYTGTGEGYRGKVTVTVKVADGKITELVLDDYADDKSYMERAKNRIFQEMISRQNTDVDAVPGATYSSNGLN